ncbi:hypothetical protein RhiirC2_323456 [Rhizophagus irregularis]|uniref:Crinkler effector protein N-terminal domain-containing protein n=1 Tax=Rhizophagus irregularis TaxID=588596 RepID=A0A2N1NIM2_9GLOM|nr:hypothetical protein RhiirC2_323456 [Rhizophagus irregularis]
MSITLFCLVKGDTIASAFSVKINRDESISNLKDAIKEKNQNDFAGVDAKRLKLWKVEIASDHLDDRLKNLTLNDSNELLAMDEIGEYWTDDPPKKHINVLVESPMSIAASSREQADKDKKSVYEQEKSVKKMKQYPSTSSILLSNLRKYQAKERALLIGRPYDCNIDGPSKL